MTARLFYITIIQTIFISINAQVTKKVNTSYDDSIKKVADEKYKKLIDSLEKTLIVDPITVSTKINRAEFLEKHLNILRMELANGIISDLLYNECSDYKEIMYTELNSETQISLRFDIISSLSKDEIKKILRLANHKNLDKICKSKWDFQQHSNESNLCLLKLKLK
jgi:hypothetical protein